MDPTSPRRLLHGMLLALLAFASCGWAHADPPSRVARLAFTSGSTSFSPGGETDWARATVNRPLVTGDRLWSDAASRAELQLGGGEIRLGAFTSVTLLNIDDRVAQVRLAQGSLNVRVWRLDRDQSFEVDTPNIAFTIRRPGSYRIDVNADGESTAVSVRAGQGEVSAEGSAFVVGQGRSFRFWGTDLRDYESVTIGRPDDFDRWASARDRRWQDSVSARYVSRGLIGYQDLDAYGSWRPIAGYGNVWTPRRVAADWAPYRDGHWAWIEPWGWTWVDAAPWGFASSHYGRWARLESAWCWVPGPVAAVPVYAPALVAFIGAGNFGGPGAARVGWFPLGPGDVYRPSYAASRGYFTRVNTSNTVINVTNITNVYNNVNISRVTYVNQQVPGAVIAVPATTFVQARPVGREAMRVTRDMVLAAGVLAAAPLSPVHASLLGAGSGAVMAASVRPPEAVEGRRVLSRLAPPPAATPFVARQNALAANAGKPLDPAVQPVLSPAAPAAVAAVKVVTAPAAVTLLPPQSRHLPPPATERARTETIRLPLPPAAPLAAAAPMPAGRPVAEQNIVPPVASRPAAQPRLVPPVERERRPERRDERLGAAPPPAPVRAMAPPAPPPPVAPQARPEAVKPVPPEARPAPSSEPAHRNGAPRAADEARRIPAPPAATRPPEPSRPAAPPAAAIAPRPALAPAAAHIAPPVAPPRAALEARPPPPPTTLAPPPPAARQAPHTPAASAAAAAQRGGRGDGGGREKKGEERRGGEDAPEPKR